MDCPKCGGGTYIVDEEFVKVIENTEPMKVVAKATYQCRSCNERFTRLIVENLDAKRKEEPTRSQGVYSGQTFGMENPTQPAAGSSEGAADNLKFF